MPGIVVGSAEVIAVFGLTLYFRRVLYDVMQSAALVVLEKANLPPAQARAIGEAVEIELVAHLDQLATKLDLADLRAEIHGMRGELRAELHEMAGGLRSEIHGMRGELHAELHEMTGGLRSEIHGMRGELRAEIHEVKGGLRAEMHGMKAELVRWVFICILGQTAAVLAWATLVINHAAK